MIDVPISLQQKQIIRGLQSLHDFNIAGSAAYFLSEASEDTKYPLEDLRRFKCFETTAIVSYSRPFSESKGGMPKLSLKYCGVRLSTEEKLLHEKLLKLRNKLIAHSDEAFMSFASTVFDVGRSDDPFPVLHVKGDEGIQFSNFMDQVALRDLIRKVSASLYMKLWEQPKSQPQLFRFSKQGFSTLETEEPKIS